MDLSVVEGKIITALTDGEQSATELALNSECDVRDVRRALASLFEKGVVQSQHDLDVELWRFA